MVVAKEPFPWQAGTIITRNRFVRIRNSLSGFYRCKSAESENFLELERDAAQALDGVFAYLANLPFKGLCLRLFGDASRIRPTYDPLTPPPIAPAVRLLPGQVLNAEMVLGHRDGSASQWIQTMLSQRGIFYDVETVDEPRRQQ